jgi:hypothetical protein
MTFFTDAEALTTGVRKQFGNFTHRKIAMKSIEQNDRVLDELCWTGGDNAQPMHSFPIMDRLKSLL